MKVPLSRGLDAIRELTEEASARAAVKKRWIDIELVYEEGNYVPGEKYRGHPAGQ